VRSDEPQYNAHPLGRWLPELLTIQLLHTHNDTGHHLLAFCPLFFPCRHTASHWLSSGGICTTAQTHGICT
jgi:hypothetical protein